MLRALLNKFEKVLCRLLGLTGGLIWACALSLAAFYFCAVFRWPSLWFIGISIILFLCCSVLGLVLYPFFGRFSIPVFNAFANDSGHAHDDMGHAWKEWLASMCLFIALIALLIGSLLQLHVIFVIGCAVFAGYAIFAPVGLGEKKRRASSHEEETDAP